MCEDPWDVILETMDETGERLDMDPTSNLVNHLLCILGTLVRMDPESASELIALIFAWEQHAVDQDVFRARLSKLLPKIHHARKSYDGETPVH